MRKTFFHVMIAGALILGLGACSGNTTAQAAGSASRTREAQTAEEQTPGSRRRNLLQRRPGRRHRLEGVLRLIWPEKKNAP